MPTPEPLRGVDPAAKTVNGIGVWARRDSGKEPPADLVSVDYCRSAQRMALACEEGDNMCFRVSATRSSYSRELGRRNTSAALLFAPGRPNVLTRGLRTPGATHAGRVCRNAGQDAA
jgi:hypothetical protein